MKNHSDSDPVLPSDPVFAEPWQARAFALAMKLSEAGHFSRKEWTAALARELSCAAAAGAVDHGLHYYEHWLVALETLAVAKGLTDSYALIERKEAWRLAYQRTPHGNPIELVCGQDPPNEFGNS